MNRCRYRNARIGPLFLGLSALAGVLAGCTMADINPHTNFVAMIYATVGEKFAKDDMGGLTEADRLVTAVRLPNGDIAYTYRGLRTCEYTFAVDPRTDRIRTARWQGYPYDCVLAP